MIPEVVEAGVVVQTVTPAVPEIPHVTAPLGACALLDPRTTAVNEIVPPKVGLPEELKKTRGGARATVVDE